MLCTVWFALYSQYEDNSHNVQRVDDDFVIEDQSEDGSQNNRQPSGTSIDRYDQ